MCHDVSGVSLSLRSSISVASCASLCCGEGVEPPKRPANGSLGAARRRSRR